MDGFARKRPSRRPDVEVLEDRLLLAGASFAPVSAPISPSAANSSTPALQAGLGTSPPAVSAVPLNRTDADAGHLDDSEQDQQENLVRMESQSSAVFAAFSLTSSRGEDGSAVAGMIAPGLSPAGNGPPGSGMLVGLPSLIPASPSPGAGPAPTSLSTPIAEVVVPVPDRSAETAVSSKPPVEAAEPPILEKGAFGPLLPDALAGVLPVDLGHLREDLDAFFARLSQLGEGSNGSWRMETVVPWLATATAVALELARCRQKQKIDPLDHEDDVGFRLDFFAEGEQG